MRPAISTLVGVVVVASTFVQGAKRAEGGDPAEPARVAASVGVPLSRYPPTHITIESDGATTITQDARRKGEPGVVVEFRLTPEELREQREAVAASRFFETWGSSRGATDQATWNVTVQVEGRTRTRDRIYDQPEFAALQRYLFRFVVQALVTADLRRGDINSARSDLPPYSDRVVHPSALVAEIVACAARIEDPARCGVAAGLLVSLPRSVDWTSGVRDLLERLKGDRRGAALAAWVDAVRIRERSADRAMFAPLALAEVRASWSRWPTMTRDERIGFEFALAMLLRDGTPEAFEISERMARELSRPGESVIPEGLLATGEAAVPIVARLLDASEPAARECGARMAVIEAGVLRKTTSVGEPLSEPARVALKARFGAELVPALERRSSDASESFAMRKECLRALDLWDGRVNAAEARAREAESAAGARADAERAKASLPRPPAGDLTIAGRLTASIGLPLPGIVVYAVDHHGSYLGSAVTAEDGSFRVVGLAAGSCDLLATEPGGILTNLRARGPHDARAIAAGSEGVVVTLPGSLIRGRLVDESNAPVARQFVVAQMRDAPSEQGPAYGGATATTDASGRFWLLRLLPGVYDVTTPGHPALRGGSGIETGPQESTIMMLKGSSLAGRFVDETGAPMPEFSSVTLTAAGASWDTLQSTKTTADGSFRFTHLDSARRYRVWGALIAEPQRSAVADDVAPGAEDVVLRVDGAPHLRIRVDFGERGGSYSAIRIERVGDGPPVERTFAGQSVHWRAAPTGTWKVFAQLHDVDAGGARTQSWVEIGAATTGEPEKTITVPR